MKSAMSLVVMVLLSSQSSYAAIKIMPLGDSITEGGYEHRPGFPTTEGAYRTDLVPQLLQINPEILFVGSHEGGPATLVQRHHEGHSGWRIDELTTGRIYAKNYERGIEVWLPTYNPNIILLMIGSNDVVQNYFLDQAPQRFQKLIEEVFRLSPCATIFVASLIPTNNGHLNTEIEKYNNAIHKIVVFLKNTKHSVVWVDMHKEANLKWTKNDYADGVHPSFRGYIKIAQVWFNHVASFLKSKELSPTLDCKP